MFVVFFRASAAPSVDYWTLFLHVAFIIVSYERKVLLWLVVYVDIFRVHGFFFFFLALMYYSA